MNETKKCDWCNCDIAEDSTYYESEDGQVVCEDWCFVD